MARFQCRSLVTTALLVASRVAFSQSTPPGADLPPVVPAPIQAPPPTYSLWVLALAVVALLLVAAAGVKLVMSGLRSSRHHRHRGQQSSNDH